MNDTTTSPQWDEFQAFAKNHSITRVRMRDVPEKFKDPVRCFREALSRQLADPENQSWDSLGPNERHNAMLAVKMLLAPQPKVSGGNCPRCAGTGFIAAYRHIKGGECLKCGGTGNIRIA